MMMLVARLQKYLSDFQERQAARDRLPKWLRLLIPLMVLLSIFGLTFGFITILWALHRTLHPEILFAATSDVAFALIIFPAFFVAMAPALMLLNFILVRIPPLKRIFDDNAKGVPGASYREAMNGLRKLAMFLVPPALALSLLGAIEPWAF